MDIINYVTEQALILIPVLYVLGLIIKGTEKISNKWIPVLLLPLGIGGAIAIIGLNANAVIQGVLVTGATVFADQIIKQVKKSE